MRSLIGKESVAEFTAKSVITGVLLGILFGAANAYLGLRVGMTVSASIPAAVIAVVLFRLFAKSTTILEVNMAQTIGSASTALATGTIFTIPALFMWGIVPPYLQITILCFLGGLLGLASMIPLRKMLIVDARDELPYPEGTACAQVLRSTLSESSTAGRWILWGVVLGIAVKVATSCFFLLPDSIAALLPILPKAEVAIELAPALIAVGYILGYRQSGILVAGSVLSAVVLIPLIAWMGGALGTPLPPEKVKLVADMSAGSIWSAYVQYIGAGAVAAGGILVVLQGLPAMYGAFAGVVRGLSKRHATRVDPMRATERDLPPWFIIGSIITVFCAAAFIPGVFGSDMPFVARLVSAVGVTFFGILFVTVAARIVGIVGVSSQPTSGIALITLLGIATIFVLNGWTDLAAGAAVLTVGTIVSIAASKAGDISQDLKTGFLVGATPAKQQFGQLIGLSFACWSVAATVLLLGSVYQFGSLELPAPQATLMKIIIEGVLQGNLPWDLVLTGAGVALTVTLCGISALTFAIGVYLPLSMMLPTFVGGIVRLLVDRRSGHTAELDSDPGILAASGLVAGEGLAGIFISGLVALGVVAKHQTPFFIGNWGTSLTLLVIGAICLYLYRAGLTSTVQKK